MTLLKNPVHPGEVLKTMFLDELGLSPIRLAKALQVPRTRIERLVALKTSMTADTALRLSRYFGNSPQFWMNMQTNYDMATASQEIDVSEITPLVA